MANDLIRTEFVRRVSSALARAQDMSRLNQPGLIGRAREVFVKELLKPVLPPYVELGSGKIADSRGCFSAEIDVVIFSGATLPPILIESGFGVYPAEACIYAIEIKSRLTADQWKDIVAKHQQLKKLHYLPAALNNIYQPIAPPAPRVIPAMFAFSSDLAPGGKDELDRYREIDPDADTNPAVPVFCIAGRGYYWYKPNEPAEKWIKHLPSQDYEEVIEFIGGVANTIPDQIVAKGRPRFGEYVICPRAFRKL